jgi:hypothetical protein
VALTTPQRTTALTGSASGRASAAHAGGHASAMAVLSIVFFMWGFVTVLNDILVPHLKGIFELSYAQIAAGHKSFTLLSSRFSVRVQVRRGWCETLVPYAPAEHRTPNTEPNMNPN